MAWRIPRQSSSASSPPSPTSDGGAPVTGSRVEASRPSGRRQTVPSCPLCYRAATDADHPREAPAPSKGPPAPTARTCRNDLRADPPRRPRRVRPDLRPDRRGGCARGRQRLQQVRGRPARPRGGAREHRLRAADGHLRPDRQDRARPPRRPEARARDVRPAAGRDHRRDDRHRGQGLLVQPRLRPDRHRVGRPRHLAGQGPRGIDDHPAARPGPPAPGRGVQRLDLRAQGARDHPVDPADPGIPR